VARYCEHDNETSNFVSAGYFMNRSDVSFSKRTVQLSALQRRELFGRPRRRWEDNIKMDLGGVGCESMDWIKVAHDAVHW
jgi:hypothetical protein